MCSLVSPTQHNIVHRGTGLKAPIPAGFCRQELEIKFNKQDDLACIKGKWSDPKITRFFEEADVMLPKVHYKKKINETDELFAPSPARPATSTAKLTAEALAQNSWATAPTPSLASATGNEEDKADVKKAPKDPPPAAQVPTMPVG